MDRNLLKKITITVDDVSLSARRAWIEISGVDFAEDWLDASLSARRAWIEITYVTRLPRAQVSLSARRAWIEIRALPSTHMAALSRSPQGERG